MNIGTCTILVVRLGNHSNRYIIISIVFLNVYYKRAHYLSVVTRDSVLVDLCFIPSKATPPNAFFFQASLSPSIASSRIFSCAYQNNSLGRELSLLSTPLETRIAQALNLFI